MTAPFLKQWVRNLFPVGAPAAPFPLIALSVAMIVVFQIPAHFILQAGWLTAGLLANEIIAVAGVPLLIILALRFDARRLLPFRRPAASAATLVILLTFAAAVLIDYGIAATERFIPPADRIGPWYDRLMATAGAGDVFLKLFALCIVPAVCEEVYFRGFCQTSLQLRWGRTPAILVAASLFALLHGKLPYAHLYFLLGLLLGWIYAETGTLWLSILAHFLNNAWTFSTHVAGFRLPLVGPSRGTWDALIIISAAILFAALALLLHRSVRHQSGIKT